jgi:hypothetical protein
MNIRIYKKTGSSAAQAAQLTCDEGVTLAGFVLHIDIRRWEPIEWHDHLIIKRRINGQTIKLSGENTNLNLGALPYGMRLSHHASDLEHAVTATELEALVITRAARAAENPAAIKPNETAKTAKTMTTKKTKAKPMTPTL